MSWPPPAYYVTLPNGDRLPIVRKDIMDAALKGAACAALRKG